MPQALRTRVTCSDTGHAGSAVAVGQGSRPPGAPVPQPLTWVGAAGIPAGGAEARRRLRECEGLVDALLHALQSAVGRKDTDNKVGREPREGPDL